jgi:hypothetical protein
MKFILETAKIILNQWTIINSSEPLKMKQLAHWNSCLSLYKENKNAE